MPTDVQNTEPSLPVGRGRLRRVGDRASAPAGVGHGGPGASRLSGPSGPVLRWLDMGSLNPFSLASVEPVSPANCLVCHRTLGTSQRGVKARATAQIRRHGSRPPDHAAKSRDTCRTWPTLLVRVRRAPPLDACHRRMTIGPVACKRSRGKIADRSPQAGRLPRGRGDRGGAPPEHPAQQASVAAVIRNPWVGRPRPGPLRRGGAGSRPCWPGCSPTG